MQEHKQGVIFTISVICKDARLQGLTQISTVSDDLQASKVKMSCSSKDLALFFH